ncbi:hypothetical protein BPUTEOMOX_1925 [methanotrophic endosymbiont of Bathymodiolus puteoserpentis (Logatchev)]|nr:hypothetical protein BPUTEOMOX_1925 [methanotrophic endosymbiont of Bathymodiolus puteoserpentis (Logatchev)]
MDIDGKAESGQRVAGGVSFFQYSQLTYKMLSYFYLKLNSTG